VKFIIDASIFIDYLRGGIIGKHIFDEIEKENGELFIPTIVIFELFSGKSSDKPSVSIKITNFIHNFERIDLTEEIAIRAGKMYRVLGKQISPQDYIVAASALEIGATVVTLNIKHFQNIPVLALYPI